NTSNELTSTSAASYGYDYNGNTTSKTVSGNTTSYTWDYENRLTQVTLPNSGGAVTFKYDPVGRRIEKISPTTTSIFVYDGDNLIETTNGSGSEVASYTQTTNIDEPLAMLRGTTKSFYEADGLGSITSLSNSSGALVQTYTYDSFGNTTNSSGSLTNFFRYTAREFDTETNLYYYRARYYDATSGRFLSEDPWDADPFYDDSNPYEYVGNNATNFVDPLGLYTLKPGVPAPSPALDKLLTCMDGCVGAPIVVTGTTNGKHQDPGHAAGTSVDIRPPAGTPASKVFCCAGQCGAAWGINEGPGGQSTPDTTAANYHLALVPRRHPSPKAPNAIPPGCTPGGCSAPK
ncbi:MAG: RHS repeat-associated core domain-containing protein, partial [Candidatus Acidiferrales bacterium]